MRFKLDENLPRLARAPLVAHGWDVDDVRDEGLVAATDAIIEQTCRSEQRILITLDNDFADTRRYDPGQSLGVIVLRPTAQSIEATLECLDAAIRALLTQPIAASLWIVEPERLRIRDYPTGA